MEIINSLKRLKKECSPSVIALGTFDGLHLGHQDIVLTAYNYARSNNLKLIVFTFSNHPLCSLKPELVPAQVITQKQKERYLKNYGVDILINVPFDTELSEISPEDFLQKLSFFNYKCLVVGKNFSYGFLGKGTIDTLEDAANKNSFEVIARDLVECDNDVISSTRIRSFIKEGNLSKANQMLGRAYSLTGVVTKGQQRGRLLGFPTANIELCYSKMAIPANGVYAVKVKIGEKMYLAMANVGNNPTFGDVNNVRLEVNIFDFDGNLYNKEITVYFYDRMRGETKFSSVEELKQNIMFDKVKIRNYFENLKISCN